MLEGSRYVLVVLYEQRFIDTFFELKNDVMML